MNDEQLRVGDAERDVAIEQLRDHMAAGRLTPAEYEERMGAALQATVRGDLAQLFRDLPGDPSVNWLPVTSSSASAPATRPTSTGTVAKKTGWSWQQGLAGAAFPLAVVICIATGWQYWWIMMLPMVISGFAFGDSSADDDDDDDDDEELDGPDRQGSLEK